MIYSKELEENNSPNYKLGEYLYMGMGKCSGHRVCISVAYKIDYCVEKANQFVNASDQLVSFDTINKVRIGELEACDKLIIDKQNGI